MECFNPTLVRLRPSARASTPEAVRRTFQSHAGSIEAATLLPKPVSPTKGFNPTLVRLRQADPVVTIALPLLFQSHAGSIEARLPWSRSGPPR